MMRPETIFTTQRAVDNLREELSTDYREVISEETIEAFARLCVLSYQDFAEPLAQVEELEALLTQEDELVLNELSLPDFNASSLKKLAGGKGYGLAQLYFAEQGLAPAGFVLADLLGIYLKQQDYQPDLATDQVWQRVFALVKQQIKAVEKWSLSSGRPESLCDLEFGNDSKPLLLAVRSGAAFSMPGAMDTVLNVGMNDQAVIALEKMVGQEAAWDAYCNFMTSYISSVHGISSKKMTEFLETKKNKYGQQLTEVELVKQQVEWLHTLVDVSADPWEQLEKSVLAVYRSYDSHEAIKYRRSHGKRGKGSHTGVNILPVLFGNSKKLGYGGSGVAYSHDLQTGKPKLNFEFAKYSQGFKVVGGEAKEGEVQQELGSYEHQLRELTSKLDYLYLQSADFEFVIEGGKLWFIQVREGKPSPQGKIQLATDMWSKIFNLDEQSEDRKIDFSQIANQAKLNMAKELLFKMIKPSAINSLKPTFDPKEEALAIKAGKLLAKGKGIGAGVIVGKLTTDQNQAEKWLQAGENVVLFQSIINSNDLTRLYRQFGDKLAIVTSKGTRSSHATSVIQNLGGVGVTGIGERNITFNDDEHDDSIIINATEARVEAGSYVSVNGSTGSVYFGKLAVKEAQLGKGADELVARRKKMGMSLWSEAVIATGPETKLEYEQSLFKLKKATPRIKKQWQSRKAEGQSLMNEILPADYLNPYQAMKLDNIEAIKKKVLQGLKGIRNKKTRKTSKHQVALRSAFTQVGETRKLGDNPWVAFSPREDGREEEVVEAWVNNDEDKYMELVGSKPKYGFFKDWWLLAKNTKGVSFEELLVGYDPLEKLDQDKADQHFVMTLQMPSGSREPVAKVEIYPGTVQMRTLEGGEDYDENNVLELEIFVNENDANDIGRLNYGVGADHVNNDKLRELVNKLVDNQQLDPYEFMVRQEIISTLELDKDENPEFEEISAKKSYQVMRKLIREREIPWQVMKDLLKKQSLNLINEVEVNLKKRWPVITSSMAAMENHVNSSLTLEFQGRIGDKDTDPLKWFLIYGMKGLEESLKN